MTVTCCIRNKYIFNSTTTGCVVGKGDSMVLSWKRISVLLDIIQQELYPDEPVVCEVKYSLPNETGSAMLGLKGKEVFLKHVPACVEFQVLNLVCHRTNT